MFNLAQLFQANLADSGRLFRRPQKFSLHTSEMSGSQVGVIGNLAITQDQPETARCHFHVAPRLLLQMPEVYCVEPWVRRDIDWHVYPDGMLCWQYPQFWFDWMSLVASETDLEGTLAYAARWCLSSVRSLLHKHRLAQELGLTEWQWPAWAHGEDEARRQYQRYKTHIARTQREGRPLIAA